MPKLTAYYKENDFKVNFGISILFIIVLYHFKYGLGMLVPTNIGWLMRWDLHGYVVLVDMYRHEPWGFPLGKVNRYFYPIGTNVGELLPMIVKLASPLLPKTFQYIGIFLLGSHILVSYYSLKIFQLFKVGGVPQLLATLLIVINPVLLYRFVHPSLTAQWLIIGSIWLYYLSSSKKDPTGVMVYQAVLFFLSSLIFPYLAVITAGFMVTLGLKLWLADHAIGFKKFSLYIVASFAVVFTVWYLMGIISFSNSVQLDVPNQYGLYGWNLSSFYNAYEFDLNNFYKTDNLSSTLPSFPLVGWQQYEGFSYLGIGMILLVLLSLVIFFLKKRNAVSSSHEGMTNIYPLAVFTLLITLFAISNTVSFNDVVLFRFPIPGFLQKLGDIFRASGRFIWVVYYLILVGTLCFLATTISRTWVTILFAVALGLQLYDLKKIILTEKFSYEPYHTPLHDDSWGSLVRNFDQIIIYPPFGTTMLTHDDYRYFTYFAALNRKPISTGYLGRVDFTSARAFTNKLSSAIRSNSFDDRWLYITTPSYLHELVRACLEDKIQVISIDGYILFFSTNRKNELATITDQLRRDYSQKAVTDFIKLRTPQPTRINRPESNAVKIGLYEIIPSETFAYVKGWAFIDGTRDLELDSVQLLLRSASKNIWSVPVKRFIAGDVADYFKNPLLQGAGFATAISTKDLPATTYQLGISIYNKKNRISGYKWSEASLELENFSIPSVRAQVPVPSDEVRSGVDVVLNNENELHIKGWGFIDSLRSRSFKKYIILSSTSDTYSFRTVHTTRRDVGSYFKDSTLITTGFKVKLKKDAVKKGFYNLGLLLEDSLKKKEYYHSTEKLLSIGYTKFAKPQVMTALPQGNETIKAFIDAIEDKQDTLQIIGWAFLDNVSTDFSESYLVLKSGDRLYSVPTTPVLRKDIQDYYKLSYKVDLAGFSVKIGKRELSAGVYQLCIMTLNKKTNIKSLQCLDTTIKI